MNYGELEGTQDQFQEEHGFEGQAHKQAAHSQCQSLGRLILRQQTTEEEKSPHLNSQNELSFYTPQCIFMIGRKKAETISIENTPWCEGHTPSEQGHLVKCPGCLFPSLPLVFRKAFSIVLNLAVT